jgi:hypothetical protein
MDQLAVVKVLDSIVDSLDIPESYYQRASDRHHSIGEWLCRPESKLARFSPHVTPQGSFRYGTVVRPIFQDAEYDLDNVVTLQMQKTDMSQSQLKASFGEELKGYARAHNMLKPLEEKPRCWRLHYADEVSFHLDSLACVTEDPVVVQAIMAQGVPYELAKRAVAITDQRHPEYELLTKNWLSSNPRGFARWFEERTRAYAQSRLRALVEMKMFASVEDVPPYQWKTPLQRSIQLLKRHRDVMFREAPDLAPISMILTNLATHAYSGEPNIYEAVTGIVAKMPDFINPVYPRVPNPTDPAEDYADKWRKNPLLEQNFRMWHAQMKQDLGNLHVLSREGMDRQTRKLFEVQLTNDQLAHIGASSSQGVRVAAVAAPSVFVQSAPKPWGI